MGWIFALACWMRILCLLWKMMHIYNNVITCIFWCKLLGLFKHWYMSCDYTAFVIRPYDKCRIITWQMSRNRYNCFLASYKLWHCYHPSHSCQFSRRGVWWGWGYLLHLRTWEGAGNGVQWMQGRRWIKGVFSRSSHSEWVFLLRITHSEWVKMIEITHSEWIKMKIYLVVYLKNRIFADD